MGKLILVANWKENGLLEETRNWFNQMVENKQLLDQNTQIVVCPPLTSLQFLSWNVNNKGLPIAIGTQDISRFEEGKHTGEVSVKMVKELATYVIVGHSERRADLGETDEIVSQKAKLANSQGLKTIVCISEIIQANSLKKLFSELHFFSE